MQTVQAKCSLQLYNVPCALGLWLLCSDQAQTLFAALGFEYCAHGSTK